MQGRTTILGLAALLCVPTLGPAEASAQERRAQPRSSSSSSDRHSGGSRSSGSGAVQRHAQPRSSASRHSPRGSATRHQAPSSGVRTPTGAQARHPRAGTGSAYGFRGARGSRGYFPYYPSYRYWGYDYGLPWHSRSYWARHYPWYGPGFGLGLGAGLGSSWYGYYPYFGGASYAYYPAPAPAAYVAYRDPDAGTVRVQVQPPKTRVYVDGHLAGVADDFDGMLQALALTPGRHELTFELDGYRTHRVLVYAESGAQLKIRHDMERGAGGPTLVDLTEGRGEEEEPPAPHSRARRDPRDERYTRHEPVEEVAPGVVRLRVTPADATVYVDGAFHGSGNSAGELALTPGAHRIEVVRPGYDPWVREVEVEAGERRELIVALPPR